MAIPPNCSAQGYFRSVWWLQTFITAGLLLFGGYNCFLFIFGWNLFIYSLIQSEAGGSEDALVATSENMFCLIKMKLCFKQGQEMKTVTSSDCRLNKSPSQECVQRKTASNVTQATKRKNMSAKIRDKSLIQIINVRLSNQEHCFG